LQPRNTNFLPRLTTRWRVTICVALVLLLGGVAAYASFPGITYNYWVDFESAALGVAPTVSTLTATTHGTGETWIISNPDSALTVLSNAQDGLAGATGNRGLQYSQATGGVDYVGMYLPSTQNTVSMGMWYCTSNQSASGYNFEEGPHFFGFYNNAFGATWRLSDERNSASNVRSIRLSPTGPDAASLRMIPVSDSTCYWISMKYVKGSTVIFNLYDTNLNLLGSVNTPETDNVGVDLVWLGNQQQTTVSLPYTMQMDDLIIDSTNANFPLLPVSAPPSVGAVPTFGGNSQHTSAYTPTSQDLGRVKWTTSLNSNTGGSASRYASPVITAANTVIAPSQIAGGAFQLNAFTGSTGASLYALSTDYVPPTSTITPVYQPVLVTGASGTRLYYAGAGGTILYIANPDSATPGTPVRQVFYTTLSDYQTRSASFNSTVFINTPLTADSNGDIFFGFRVQGTAPSPLSTQDGIARIDANGNGTYVLVGTAAADSAVSHDAQNSAPALSNDGTTVYVAAKSATSDDYAYLLGLDSTALTTKYRVLLTDPRNGNGAGVVDASTASPTIGPDNDVYFGTMANPDNGSRGFLLHFSSDLTVTKTPGAFGWDNTPAIVSSSLVSSYTGSSAYLLLSNYNDYVGQMDGQGVNKVALLDPTATETDSHSSSNGLSVMREILDATGPTPDAANQNSTFPSAVLPWLGNAFAVNAPTKTVILPSSDGNLYRWNVSTNSISQFLNLGAAGGAQNVPTVIGPDGSTYTISGSTLASVQGLSGVGVNVTSSNPDERTLAAGQSVTFTATVTNGGGSGTPTGSVTFTDTVSTVVSGSLNTTTNTLGSATLNNGVAALSAVTLTTGNHFITANYSGGGSFPAGSGGMVQVVHGSASTTTVAATPNPSNVGQSVTFNVTVASVPAGGAAPTGQVTLTSGSTTLAQLTLSNGAASFATSTLPSGSNAIVASYSGDNSYSSSQGNTTAVVQSPTLNSLSSSSNPATQGQSVTFTATVTSSGGTPVGSVTFTDGSTVLASNVTVTSGVATFSTSSLATGSHSIVASFTASAGWQNSTSGTLTEQINQTSFATSTTVASSLNPSNSGQSVTFTATVTSTGGTPSGTVTFSQGSTVLALNVAVNTSGQAVFSTSTLAVGTDTITASFTGANGFGTSSGSVAQVVQSVSNGSYPGITYDDWIDFEGVAIGGSPTATTLASSTHGTAGTWTVTNSKGSLSAIAAAQDTIASAPGTRGIQYSSTTGDPQDYMQFALPATKNQVSLGMYYCTSNQSSSVFNFEEGPHFLGFSSNSFGDLWRLVDERNAIDNSRSIRISPTGPTNSVKINVTDNTCYWLAFRYVKSGTVDFSIYDTNLNLIQHVSTPETFGQTVDNLFLGNDLANGDSQTFYTFKFDDLIVDYTNANFPLLPTTGAPVNSTVAIASSLNPANIGQSVTFTATVTPAASGTASFSDGSTVLASGVAVTSGQATFTTSTLAAGSHTIGTTFTPASGTPSTATLTQSVTTPTLTALTSSANPSAPGQSVTFTATVTATSGTPTGSVTFTDGSTTLASNVAVNASGVATFTTTSLATASHSITASFTGTGTYTNSSGSLTQSVQTSSSTTSVASSLSPSTFGQSVTFTATVSSSSGTPTGTVTFLDGANTIASGVTVTNGVAAASSTTLAVGSHTITANFIGTGGYGNSSSSVAQSVQGATSTALSSSANPSASGSSVTFTATITSSGGTPTGTVTFTDGATTLASNVAVSAGKATFATTALAVGTHSIVATFTGTGGFANSASTALSQVVTGGSTTTTVTSSANPSTSGSSITLTATITSAGGTPTGTVKFTDGATTLASAVTVSGGTATFTSSTLAVGSHSITAAFTGTGGFTNSSGTLTQIVQISTSNSVASSLNPSNPSQSVTFTATVTSSNGIPKGTMAFMDGATTLASGVSVSTTTGRATFATTSLVSGTHSITAVFTGSTGWLNSTSTAISQVVNAATTTTVTASPSPQTTGLSVTISATVTSAAGTPTGTVTFKSGSTTLASNVALTGGTASISTTALKTGTDTITVTYNGATGFATSSGTTSEVMQADTSPPTTPTNVAAVSGPNTRQITVSWTASTDNVGVKDYEVFRATTATGTFSLAATVTTTSFTDTQLLSGLTRYYYVVAVDTTNHLSGNSAHVSATSK
jgi:Bacterial Ig-like domain (group 3)